MPMGPYENFAACVTAQKNKGHGDESAHKICGYIKAKTESLEAIEKENLMKRRREDYGTDASVLPVEYPEENEMGAGGQYIGINPVIEEPIPDEAASQITVPTVVTMESDVAIGKVIVEKGERVRILSKREAARWKEENPIANGGFSRDPQDVNQPDKGERREITVDGSEQLLGGDCLSAEDVGNDKVAFGLSADVHGNAETGTKTDKVPFGLPEKIKKMEAELAEMKRQMRRF